MDLDSSRIRVAIVAPSLRILGGQAVQADRLLRAWQDDPQLDAWLVPHNPVPPRPLQWATRVKYARTLVTEACYLALLFRELRRADVVHVFSASYTSFLLAPLPAVLVAKLLGKPVVLNYRSGEAPDHLRRSAIARWVLRHVDQNAVPSAFLQTVFAEYDVEATVIPNLVALDRFPYRPRTPLRPRLLSTRNLEPLYNVACTLRAFQQIQGVHPDATLTLVGAGSEEPALRDLARDLGLRHVTFAGRVAPESIASCYDTHDIYIQSPNIDNMPASVLEAYASGLPVVSTDAGGVPTIVRHGEQGLLAPVNDHDQLAAHVLHLLAAPDRARALAEAGHASLQASAWPRVREQWLALYRVALARESRVAAVQA
ncbi:MAG: glycosyltransferase family 4 protein [Acidobacteria bacterium]|nr:glycosyltransferase family 4 protein [Acidobacteriota bacterium]